MSRKVIIDCDPGIDDAVALILALFDPRLDVLAVTTSAGTVPVEQSAQNVQSLIEKLDPPRFPRVGLGTDPEDAPVLDESELHGHDGLGNLNLSRIDRQHLMPSEKLIVDLVKSESGRVTILCLGPLTGIARAMQRDPSIISKIDRIVVVGGAVPGDGDITPAAEFNMYFDPASANRVLRSATTKTLLPLEIVQQVRFGLDFLSNLPLKYTRAGGLLHSMLSHSFRAYRQLRGMESISLKGPVGVAYLLEPELFECQQHAVVVEEQGTVTRGATIVDRRLNASISRDLEIVSGVDATSVRELIVRTLRYAGQCSE
ncbi:MAG: nucleoside hydrolase [Pirellula sp.]|jgi:inosine-uridine nucleoside N-ribohydrolase|nr:nucleoside hydrolase [Planctomycetota bacterium]